MANPMDVRVRKKGHVVTVRIKVGGQWLDRSGGWRTGEEATAPTIALRDQLQADYAKAHPETNPENNVAGAEANPRPTCKILTQMGD